MSETARVAELVARFDGAKIPAGLVCQVAAVVGTAGVHAVARLGPGMLTDPDAGRVMAEYLRDARRRARPRDQVVRELTLVAQLQTLLRRSMDEVPA